MFRNQNKKFTILFQNEALAHFQKAIDYYNLQQSGLGKRYGLAVMKTAKQLVINPFFQIRYDNVRCLPVHKFPFMLHFTVNEDLKRIRSLQFYILH